MKKRAVLLTALAMVTVAGCSSAPANSGDDTAKTDATNTSTGEKILSVQIGPNPETMDPALNSAVDGGNMILTNFECLLTIGKDGSVEPGQAESWEVSDDGLTYTFHLRPDLKWSDGSDLTAEDFVYSWQRVTDPEVAAPYAETVLGMVEGYDEAVAGDITKLNVEAPDEDTFVVHLANPCPYFEELAAFATLSPVQQEAVEKFDDPSTWSTSADTYVSNGPFYITEWVPSSHITMSKNPNYWDADNIKLDGIKFNLIEDANAAYSAYQTGEVALIKDVPTEEIPSLSDNDEFHVEPLIGTYYVSMNDEKEPFTNKDVRKALSLAIDRDYVANTLMQGTYSPATNFVGPGWTDPTGGDFAEKANNGEPYIDTTDYEANLEEAKKLLADAGYPNGEGLPTLTYTTNDSGYHKAVAEYLQQAWKELGVNMDVEIVEWASFTPMRRNGDYEIARNGWVGDYADPSNILELLYSTNGNNDGKYNNPEFDAAIEESRTTTDPEKRSAALHKAEDILMEDAGMIPLAYYNDFWLENNNTVKGIWHSPYGYWHFEDAELVD